MLFYVPIFYRHVYLPWKINNKNSMALQLLFSEAKEAKYVKMCHINLIAAIKLNIIHICIKTVKYSAKKHIGSLMLYCTKRKI